jgi:phosphate/sulfate permease
MVHHIKEKINQFARAYWQQLILSVLAILVLSQVVAWGMAISELSKVDRLISQTEDLTTSSQESQKNSDQTAKPAESAKPAIAKKNIFLKDKTSYQLTAIFLDKAVINGQTVAVGQNVGKSKVKEIGVAEVIIEDENGKTQTLKMFRGGPSNSSSSSKNSGRARLSSRSSSTRTNKSKSSSSASGRNVQSQRSSVEIPRNLPPGVTADVYRTYMNASPDEQQRMRREYMRRIGRARGRER